jgi:hypothetical protein
MVQDNVLVLKKIKLIYGGNNMRKIIYLLLIILISTSVLAYKPNLTAVNSCEDYIRLDGKIPMTGFLKIPQGRLDFNNSNYDPTTIRFNLFLTFQDENTNNEGITTSSMYRRDIDGMTGLVFGITERIGLLPDYTFSQSMTNRDDNALDIRCNYEGTECLKTGIKDGEPSICDKDDRCITFDEIYNLIHTK